MAIEVVLEREDLRWASDIALQRIALAKGDPRFAYKGPEDGLNTHALGCFGELAFARAVGLEWPAHVGTYREKPDVFPFWEVRWSSSFNRIKVATDDPGHYLVAHVTGRPPGFEVHGYIVASWAHERVPATDPGERGRMAHFVDTAKMAPIDDGFHELHAWINGYGDRKGWLCLYCGEEFRDGLPVSRAEDDQDPE